MKSKVEFYKVFFEELEKKGFGVAEPSSPDYVVDIQFKPKIRTIVTQNLRFENTKPGQEQAIPFNGLCSPASSAYG